MIYDRPYQTEAVQSIWDYFRSNTGNPLVAMPTGTGKSIVIARFLQSVYPLYPNQRVLMLTHVKELIQQNYNKLMAVWSQAPCGIFSAGLNQKVHNRPITFAGVASIAKKAELFGHIDLVLIDEAHLVSPSETTMYRKFLAELLKTNPYLKIIGFTATPWRLGHGRLIDPVVNKDGIEVPSIFTDFCFDITGLEAFNRLIAEGYLIPLIPKRTKTLLSVDGVHMRGGEFIESELQTAVDKDEITYEALKEAMELGYERRKWLIFAAGTEHADHIAEMLNSLGVSTGVVHSKTEGRDETLRSYDRGELRAVVNCNCLTTGFDQPDIDMIICLRPTASAVLWCQLLGRGTRPFFAKGYDLNTIDGRLAAIKASVKHNTLVLDYAGNTRRLGPINDPLIPKRKGEKGGEAPVKCCECCDTWNHASVRFCVHCGHEFLFETKLKFKASSDELIKGDMPITEVFKVDHITINKHTKINTPDMMRISYYCGLNKFDEYVCPEHTNYAANKAARWWSARSRNPMPRNTDEAIALADRLPHATHIRVWINKQYPEIMAYCFDGTAFGTQEMSDSVPEVTTLAKVAKVDAVLEDDIPF
jgi:DNA repair protein RadD